MSLPQWLQTHRAKAIAVCLIVALGVGAGGLALALSRNEAPRAPALRSKPSTAKPSSTSTPAPAVRVRVRAPAPHSPLTGLPGRPAHRVIAVKVTNIGPEIAGTSRSNLTQFGIGSADVVVEELVEGGLTRLIAMYQSTLPTRVGPVRSLRATDSYVVLPVRGLLLSSGGSGLEVRALKTRHVDFRSGGVGYGHVSSRPSVYSVVVDTKSLRQPYSKVPDLLRFGKPPLSKAKTVPTFTVRFSSKTVRFTYHNGIYLRESDLAQVRFPAKNVLVLQTHVRSLFVDQHGAKVPEEVLAGSGKATLYSRGRMITGRWQKSSQSSPIKTTFAVPPGKTAIELMPANQP
ncbi:MAG: DUF3048 domain-containing protein [Dermatophilaceae bacterium]